MNAHHLAQFNVARMRAPLDDPVMAEFAADLQPLNSLADSSPGFVWRLQTEDGDSTGIRGFDDDLVLVNLTVWESIEALRAYVYESAHVATFSRRAAWFEDWGGPSYVLWWTPRGELPTLEAGKARLEHLTSRGETPFAFSFGKVFGPED